MEFVVLTKSYTMYSYTPHFIELRRWLWKIDGVVDFSFGVFGVILFFFLV